MEVTRAIVTPTHPRFGDGSAPDAAAPSDAARAAGDVVLETLWRNVADLRTLRERELDVVGPLAEIAGDDRVTVLPLLDRDVHDLDGLRTMAGHLFDHPIAER